MAKLDKFHNFVAERDVKADDKTLRSIGDCATKALKLMTEIEGLTDTLKVKKEELRRLQAEDLPQLMLNAGTSAFDTIDGFRLERGLKVEGALPKPAAQRERALNIIEKLGAADLIRTEMALAFPREHRDNAVALFRVLKAKGYEPEVSADVHHMTLKAWARERFEAGLVVPANELGLWIGDWTSIARAK